MKKFLCLVLALTLILTSSLPVFAAGQSDNAKISLKQAIESAKNKLGISSEGMKFESSYSEGRDGKKFWYLNWNSKQGGTKGYSVTIDADNGNIVNYYTYSPSSDTSRIPKHTREQALKAATDFAAKLQPEKFNQTKLVEDDWTTRMYDSEFYSDTYTFVFVRYVSEIPYIDNRINISVEKNSLNVRNYSLDWDEKTFTEPKDVLTVENAKKIFEEKLGLEASYQQVYSSYDKPPKFILVYSLKKGNKPIDAFSGEVISYNDYYPMYDMGLKRAAGEQKSEELTPEEQNSVDQNSKLISKDKAIELVKQYMQIEEKFKLTSSNLSKGYPEGSNSVWHINWEYNDETSKTYGYKGCSVDAVTGEIKSLHMGGSEFEPDKNATPKHTKEGSKAIAEDFLKKIQPEKFASCEYVEFEDQIKEAPENPSAYHFNYIRKFNGITCAFNRINVTVNPYNGQITNYGLEWYDNITLPESEGMISLEEAYKVLYQDFDFSLKYIKKFDYWQNPAAETEIKLVYMLKNQPCIIDAKTGALRDYNGEPVKKSQKATFTDIKGHWAENDVSILVELGILDADSDKFLPDSKIKQKDFIKLLMKSNGPDYRVLSVDEDVYDRYYGQAIDRKVMFPKEKNPDASVTRLDAAKYIVRNLNIAYLADINGIYNPKFSDVKKIDSRNLGYVSIVSGLNIINGTKGHFLPERSLTKAEAAVIIVRLLKVDTTNKE